MILTDQTMLRQKSVPVDANSYDQITQSLLAEIPEQALGLAAPQIGDFRRAFVANLSTGQYVFFNPELTDRSEEESFHVEGCLSIPEHSVRLDRSEHVTVKADRIIQIDNNERKNCPCEMSVSGHDASVIQHEYDHIEGILIVDRGHIVDSPSIKIVQENARKRAEKLAAARQARKIANELKTKSQHKQAKQALTKQSALKTKKLRYKSRRQERERVETKMRYALSRAGLTQETPGTNDQK